MSYMDDIRTAKVVGFGNIFHAELPKMRFVMFERGYGYQAVCIGILMDATGKNKEDACKNLMRVIESYIKQTIHEHNDNKDAAFEHITQINFSSDELKSVYYDKYQQAKYLYSVLKEKAKAKARTRARQEVLAALAESFARLWKTVLFPHPRIWFSFTVAMT